MVYLVVKNLVFPCDAGSSKGHACKSSMLESELSLK